MANKNLNKGAVLITGASSGIGRSTALYLDQLGFIVFAGIRKAQDAQSLKASASKSLRPLTLDVTDEKSIQAAVSEVSQALNGQGLAGLVNNAGIGLSGPLEFFPVQEFRRQIEINTIAPMQITQAFLPLIRQGSGRIVMMGSIGGRMATPIIGAYTVSKFALVALADCLRIELSPWKIAVSIVEPGFVSTPFFDKARQYSGASLSKLPGEGKRYYSGMYQSVMDGFARMAKGATSPEDVARAVAQALSDAKPKTRYVVGGQAKVGAILSRLLSDRTKDALTTKMFKLSIN